MPSVCVILFTSPLPISLSVSGRLSFLLHPCLSPTLCPSLSLSLPFSGSLCLSLPATAQLPSPSRAFSYSTCLLLVWAWSVPDCCFSATPGGHGPYKSTTQQTWGTVPAQCRRLTVC